MRFINGGWRCYTECVDGNNTPYPDFISAWTQCEKTENCTKIMKYGNDGKFYLRKDDDKPDDAPGSLYVEYGCRGMIIANTS